MSIELESPEQVLEAVKTSTELYKNEGNRVMIDSDDMIIIDSDRHGDQEIAEFSVEHIERGYICINKGDDPNRAPEKFPLGSFKTVALSAIAKATYPDRYFSVYSDHNAPRKIAVGGLKRENRISLGDEVRNYEARGNLPKGYTEEFLELVGEMFAWKPYAVQTKNGLINFHAGPPRIKSYEEFEALPRGLKCELENPLVAQMVWSDNLVDDKGVILGKYREVDMEGKDVVDNTFRFEDEKYSNCGNIFGSAFLERILPMFGAEVLGRGHGHYNPGWDASGKVITTISGRHIPKISGNDRDTYGLSRGAMVLYVDPTKHISEAIKIQTVNGKDLAKLLP